MSSPSPVQIREANAHLAALHRRVADLEQKLEAAENTLREQAESLIRKDEQLRASTQEITENKDSNQPVFRVTVKTRGGTVA
ncbi:vimentin-type intermediate filament-associated coiled-coil protein [Tachysurus ichikawai]